MFAALILSGLAMLAQDPTPELAKPNSTEEAVSSPTEKTPQEGGQSAIKIDKPAVSPVPAGGQAIPVAQPSQSAPAAQPTVILAPSQAIPTAPSKPRSKYFEGVEVFLGQQEFPPDKYVEYQPTPVLVTGGCVPQFGVVEGIKDGKLLVREPGNVPTLVSKRYSMVLKRPKQVDGHNVTQSVKETYYDSTLIYDKVLNSYDPLTVQVYDVNGTPIAQERWTNLFAKPCIVLITRNDLDILKEIDPAYLKVVGDSVPLVVLPMPEYSTRVLSDGKPKTN